MLSNLSVDQKVAIRRAALNGDYHLLLGAGASRDSTSPEGDLLPGSEGLSEEMSRVFKVEMESGDLLWRIYDRAVRVAGEEEVYQWLKKKFWKVSHPYWMNYYARSPWNTVWTLNIDDSFEAAYASIKGVESRELRILNWDDDYSKSKMLDVIHLHGIVDRDEPRSLVFSLSEYASSAASSAAWPLNFRDSYGNSPFVIIGARLRDEPDIENVIARRSPTNEAPSFYVSRSISSAMKDDLDRWGLVPVEMSAEDFVLEWAELTGLDLENEVDSEFELGMRVGQQFTTLGKKSKMGASKDHDFFGGDEPAWADILSDLPANLSWVKDAKVKCDDLGKGTKTASLIAYSGRRLSGRSTGLLQIANHLNKASWKTFYFRKNERIDIEAIVAYAANGKSIALLFDSIADVVDDVNNLITEARTAKLKIVCIAVEDNKRVASILGRIDSAYLAGRRVFSISSRLSDADAKELVAALDRRGRLGVLEGIPHHKQLKHFRGSDMFESMARVENAPGFGKRVGDLLRGFSDNRNSWLILLAAYASYVDRSLAVIDVARMVGVDSDELVNIVDTDEHLSSLIYTDGLLLKCRHRWMALDPIIQLLGKQRSLEILGQSIRRISSRLNLESYRERNATTMLVGSMMQHKNLFRFFAGQDLDSWYANLIDVFGDWSGHYWEQRAIQSRRESANDVTLLAKAESFAMRAKEFLPDTYRFTTLGTVLMEKASRADVDILDYFNRAESAFSSAAERDRDTSSSFVTWNAYLQFSLGVLAKLKRNIEEGVDSGSSIELYEKVDSMWVYRHNTTRLIAQANDETLESLDVLRRKYENITSKRLRI